MCKKTMTDHVTSYQIVPGRIRQAHPIWGSLSSAEASLRVEKRERSLGRENLSEWSLRRENLLRTRNAGKGEGIPPFSLHFPCFLCFCGGDHLGLQYSGQDSGLGNLRSSDFFPFSGGKEV